MALTTDTCLAELRRMLVDAGFDEATPDLAVLESSLELREGGKYSFGPSFVVGFTRQFSFEDEEGEYAGMEVVRAELRYAVHDDFRAITKMRHDNFGTADQFWGAGGPRAEEWTGRVERCRSCQVALDHRPLKVELYHSPV